MRSAGANTSRKYPGLVAAQTADVVHSETPATYRCVAIVGEPDTQYESTLRVIARVQDIRIQVVAALCIARP
jgi:hypothetical protein